MVNPGTPSGYRNLDPHPVHGIAAFLRWKLTSWPARWPTWVDDPPAPALVSPGPGEVVVTFINHATLLIQTPAGNLITDPVFSQRTSPLSWLGPKRIRRPGLSLDQLPPIHGVLLSHDHYDHLDRPSLRAIGQRWQPWVATPAGVGRHLRGLGLGPVTELAWWSRVQHGDLTLTCTPAQHFSGRGLFDRNDTLWGGLSLQVAGQHLYFAGDTGYGRFFRDIQARLGAPDLALLPIGAYAPRWFMKPVHMDPSDAVQAHLDLGSQRSLGIHWGTWQLTDEPMTAPLEALAAARSQQGLAADQFGVLGHGESWVLAAKREPGTTAGT